MKKAIVKRRTSHGSTRMASCEIAMRDLLVLVLMPPEGKEPVAWLPSPKRLVKYLIRISMIQIVPSVKLSNTVSNQHVSLSSLAHDRILRMLSKTIDAVTPRFTW